MRTYLTEFIGTFFLVLTIGLTVLAGTPLAPVAIGAALMAMVYMGGHVSGAHYNPAVSLALAMRGKLAWGSFPGYVGSQVAGSLAASAAVSGILGQTFGPGPGEGVSAMSALLVEILFTFALCLVVLNVATSSKTQGNSYYGLAIGFTVAAGAVAGGPVSGGAFNPAVGIGPLVWRAFMGGGAPVHLWLYLVGPLLGGGLAAGVFGVQEGRA
jgi:aquaporin Z